MTDSKSQPETDRGPHRREEAQQNVRQELSPAARRALAEAEERRKASAGTEAAEKNTAKEIGGRDGPEPVRYGDWEKGGIISDF